MLAARSQIRNIAKYFQRLLSLRRRLAQRRETIAVAGVVVYEPGGLHECVDDCGPNEAKAALLEVLADGVGDFCADDHFACGVQVRLQGLAVDEAPDVVVEAAKFLLDFEEGLSVGDGGTDLQTVTDDARIGEQGLFLLGVETRDFFGVEIGFG